MLGVERMRRRGPDLGVPVMAVDTRDPYSLQQALAGAFAVVNARGPFHACDYTVAEKCADQGIHYIDLAEARDYVNGIARLAPRTQRSGALVVSGAGAAPALSAALVDLLAAEFDRISEIYTFLVPGRRDHRELATMRAVLRYAGREMRVKERGRWRWAYGWSRPETVELAAPAGRRRGYLCDLPDLDLFPRRYGAATVTARTGLVGSYNLLLSALSLLRRHGVIDDLPRAAQWLIRLDRVLGGKTRSGAGMRVRVYGYRDGQALAHTVDLIARDDNAPAIPAAPVLALVKRWVRDGVPHCGAQPAVGLLTWEEIRSELLGYDIVMVRA